MEDWRSYDEVAEVYERVNAPHMAQPARDLVAMAGPPTGGRILDVGTGTGVAAAAAAATLGPDGLAVGIDASVGMIAQASRAHPELRLAAASAIDLPFRDGTFDAVTANFVLSHFTRYETALFDMIRVLRPGGRLALTSWASDDIDDLQRTWRELVESVVEPSLVDDVREQVVPWADRFGNREPLEQALLDAGLRHIRTEHREYHFVYSLDEYVDSMGTWTTGRFVRSMLGADGWDAFQRKVRDVYAERFSDPVNDFRQVWLAVGTKPS